MRRHRALLVVGTRQDHACMIEDSLEVAGFGIVSAYDGEDALRTLRSNAVDLIVLGCASASEGIAALRTFHEIRPEDTSRLRPTVPVVMAAASASDRDASRASELGVVGFLKGDFLQPDLVRLVNRALGVVPAD